MFHVYEWAAMVLGLVNVPDTSGEGCFQIFFLLDSNCSPIQNKNKRFIFKYETNFPNLQKILPGVHVQHNLSKYHLQPNTQPNESGLGQPLLHRYLKGQGHKI